MTMPGTAETIAWGLELPVFARRRFRADRGCALAEAEKKRRPDDDRAGWRPAAKVAALWRADLADGRAWRYEYESHAWGYAALRWLLVDSGSRAGTAEQRPVSGADVELDDVARLRAITGAVSGLAGPTDPGRARRALVSYLSTEADRMLHGRCGALVHRELLAATAEATLLAGRLTYACWPRAALAQAYQIQGLGLAQACGDRQLGGAILYAMSEQAASGGHLDEARDLVRMARSGCPEGHGAPASSTPTGSAGGSSISLLTSSPCLPGRRPVRPGQVLNLVPVPAGLQPVHGNQRDGEDACEYHHEPDGACDEYHRGQQSRHPGLRNCRSSSHYVEFNTHNVTITRPRVSGIQRPRLI
jgi:hypothetical protein